MNIKFYYRTFLIPDDVLKDNHFLLHYFEIHIHTFNVGSIQSQDDV